MIASRRNNWRWWVALCVRMSVCWVTLAGTEMALLNQFDLMDGVDDDRLTTVCRPVEGEVWLVAPVPGGCDSAAQLDLLTILHRLTTGMRWVRGDGVALFRPHPQPALFSDFVHGARRSPVKSGIGDRSPPASSHQKAG